MTYNLQAKRRGGLPALSASNLRAPSVFGPNWSLQKKIWAMTPTGLPAQEVLGHNALHMKRPLVDCELFAQCVTALYDGDPSFRSNHVSETGKNWTKQSETPTRGFKGFSPQRSVRCDLPWWWWMGVHFKFSKVLVRQPSNKISLQKDSSDESGTQRSWK